MLLAVPVCPYNAWSTRWRSSASPALPNIIRLMSFNLLTYPSMTPLLCSKVRPANTAALSFYSGKQKD